MSFVLESLQNCAMVVGLAFVITWLSAWCLRTRGRTSPWVALLLSLGFTLVAAPVPMPLEGALWPHAYMLPTLLMMAPAYLDPDGLSMVQVTLGWIGPSLVLTFVPTFLVVTWYLRRRASQAAPF